MHAEFRLDDAGCLSLAETEHRAFEFLHELATADEAEVTTLRRGAGVIGMPLGEPGEINACVQAIEHGLHLCAGGGTVGIAEPWFDEDMRKLDLFGHTREAVTVCAEEFFHLKTADLRRTEALLLEFLSEQIPAHLIAVLALDAAEGLSLIHISEPTRPY